MKSNKHGQILPVILVTLAVLTLIISGLITWIQNDTKWSVKEQKSNSAINFAEAGIDRGTWKLQSTTSTWAQAANGTLIAYYNFDKTFRDISGGTYRIKFSPGPGASEVTIMAEGRDGAAKEIRAITAVYRNQTIYSSMMAGGNVTWAQGLGVYWGPIVSQGDIQLMDDNVARRYFPQKYAKGVVIGNVTYPRDQNGLAAPNSDSIEWWSNYPGVPGLPLLDFSAMRSSATASGTLNVYGCGCAAAPVYTRDGVAAAAWDARTAAQCNAPFPPPATADTAPHTTHLGDSTGLYAALGLNPALNYVWYWDTDVVLEGYGYNGSLATSLRGSVIVRRNLTINSSGDMIYWGHVPSGAWQQHQKLLTSTFDTAAASEYPADLGFHVSTGLWHFGADSWNEPGLGGGWVNTVGIQGFVYVGQDLRTTSFLDIHGAVWVNGNVVSNYAAPDAFCGIFYDDTLNVPALNVILVKQSWKETRPSNIAWTP